LSDFIAFVAFISGNFYTKFSIGKAKRLPIMSYPGYMFNERFVRIWITDAMSPNWIVHNEWYSIGTTVITST
jgi:hypothetical protein